ncbi:MAG: bifunctional DNA-formamidopyrimidine glycosylase/DNA-(apurinic or apyrimidinic site) lyase [Pyrinomonadaceae bacterium]
MPELPEVELITRALRQLVLGRRIVRTEIRRDKLIAGSTVDLFVRNLQNTEFLSVHRRGKYIILEFNNSFSLLVHLRMTGRFQLLTDDASLPKFAHAIFYLDDERRLVFSDQRHFGMMKLIRRNELCTTKEIVSLAPEPFSSDFTSSYLKSVLSKTKRSLKETLLDQTKVTGLGNIYCAEALFLAGANPLTPACEFSLRRIERLHKTIVQVLYESIAFGSTLNIDPENIEGGYFGGPYEGRWRVYDRESEPCYKCSARIRRITQGGRSTYYCPRCQRR